MEEILAKYNFFFVQMDMKNVKLIRMDINGLIYQMMIQNIFLNESLKAEKNIK